MKPFLFSLIIDANLIPDVINSLIGIPEVIGTVIVIATIIITIIANHINNTLSS